MSAQNGKTCRDASGSSTDYRREEGLCLNAAADPAEQLFSGGDNRPYDDFYAALQAWGRY